MEALFLRVVWISLTCSAVLVPLLVGKGWLRRHVRAKALYVVWLILALRLVIPVDLSLPEPAVTVEAPSYQVSLPARAPSANLPAGAQIEEPSAVVGQTAPEAASAVRTIPVTALLSALWLFGVLAAALVQGGGYLLARRRLLRDARPDLEAEAQAGQTAASLGLKRAVPVRRSRQVRTPMVLGLIRPVLLLPEGQAVDEVVLCHELTHLKRLDLAYKALLVAACWLHWFNPLVWWMSRAASENLELCCDDDVAAGRDAAFRRKYGELLLSTAEEKPGPTLSSRFGGSKQAMKDRLTNLFVKKKRGRLLACTAVAVLILVGGLVACEGQPAMTDMEALEALEESLSYDGERVSFTIPEGDREWNIHIAGRADTEELGGISLHYLEGIDFVPGETYSFELSAAQAREITALTIEITLGSGTVGGISITPLLRKPVSYVNEEYGFTLTLPDGWADQVEIREGESDRDVVSFYMRDALSGRLDGAGWLISINRRTLEDWQSLVTAGYPHAEQRIAAVGEYVLYTIGPTGVEYDENNPAEVERYQSLAEGIPELLDSFALIDSESDAAVRNWSEDLEAVETFQKSISFDRQGLSFTIPEGNSEEWKINFTIQDSAGEPPAADVIQDLNETNWMPGKTYHFPLEDVVGLTMNVSMGDGAAGFSRVMSARNLAPENPTYVNQEYGFSLILPDGWADQVEIREDDPNMQNVTCAASFYMRDAGDWYGAGFLLCINRCTSQEWAEIEAAGNPYGLPLLADTGIYVFYAAFPTDVRCDENDPSEKERYDNLEAGIPNLLDSFSLINGGAYATAQTWLEEQEAVETFQENSPYVNQEYGFTLTLPDGWADQVEIRENDPNTQNGTCMVSFYMQDAGNWEGAGLLASISQCTPEEWAQNQENGNPAAWEFLADLGQKILYAEPSTDLPVDPAIPGALERYTQFSAQISKLLESFTLPA